MSTTAREDYRTAGETGMLNGWIVFVAVLLLVGGMLDFFWGLAAILNNEVVRVGGRGVVVWDITAWGWGHLILSAAMMLTALGLFAAQGWARWMAVLFVSLNMLVQFGSFTVFPLWSLMMIGLNVVLLHQLIARWDVRY